MIRKSMTVITAIVFMTTGISLQQLDCSNHFGVTHNAISGDVGKADVENLAGDVIESNNQRYLRSHNDILVMNKHEK